MSYLAQSAPDGVVDRRVDNAHLLWLSLSPEYASRPVVVDLGSRPTGPRSTTRWTRFDLHLLVNDHVYGMPAGQSPVLLYLRRVPVGRMWDHYMRSFDEVWKLATPES